MHADALHLLAEGYDHHAPSLSILLCVRSEMKLAPMTHVLARLVRPAAAERRGDERRGRAGGEHDAPERGDGEAVAASARTASANARAEGRGDEAPPRTSGVDSAAGMMARRRPRDARADVRDPRRTRRVTPPEIQTDER